MHRASLNEAAAAGILQLAGWHQACRQEGAGAAGARAGVCGRGAGHGLPVVLPGALAHAESIKRTPSVAHHRRPGWLYQAVMGAAVGCREEGLEHMMCTFCCRPALALNPKPRAVLPAVLADPMCGSGTFLIEAALMATDVAPGSFRRWWPFTQAGAGRGGPGAAPRDVPISGSMCMPAGRGMPGLPSAVCLQRLR